MSQAMFVALAVLLSPSPAHAHLVTTGLGPVYDGLAHFALTPEDLVPTLALSLFAGLRGPSQSRRLLFILPPIWLLAALTGLATSTTTTALPVTATLAPSISFILLGILLATDAHLPPIATTAVAVALGTLHGYLNGTTMSQAGLGPAAPLGIATAIFTLIALASSTVVPLRTTWSRIIIRITGSWIAATGLLLLAWTLRPTT